MSYIKSELTNKPEGGGKTAQHEKEAEHMKKMFKEFLERIIAAENREDAVQNVFYGTVWEGKDGKPVIVKYGIEIAAQHELITHKEEQMLLALIEKMA